ncbi:MAG: uracil phosphoribosyltransferase [Planctomycetes bacterium]|nr:uracil phosphoribosyltransferase [Planctomycetota bacterium]
MTSVIEVGHPLIQHHLARLRDVRTAPAEFRALVQRVAALLAYEATQDLPTEPVEIDTPLTRTAGRRVSQRVGLVPILRAGLGMVDPVLNLIPEAEVWHLGLYRDEETAQPVRYYNKIPPTGPVDTALVLDPMLATGGSISEALETVHAWGVPKVKVLSILAARPGVAAVLERFPETQIYVCAVDPELNDRKFIVPGLGDAGDRAFNTLR